MADFLDSETMGSASSTAIGDTKPFHSDDELIVLSGEHWLRTGIVDDDLTAYPSAKRTPMEIVTKEKTGLVNLFHFTWDGSHFWILDYDKRQVTQYDEQWQPTGVSFSAAGEAPQYASGIFYDGTHLVITSSNRAYKYLVDGTYVSSYDIGGLARSLGDGCVYNNHVYLEGYFGEVVKITKDGSLVKSYDISSTVTAVEGIEVIGDKFYVGERNSGFVYEFDADFNPTGEVISLGQTCWNLCGKDTYLYSSNGSNIVRAIRAEVVGIPERLEQNAVPLYVRVK